MTMGNRSHPVAALSLEEFRARCDWIETEVDRAWRDGLLDHDVDRFYETLQHVPPATSSAQRLLDVGCYGMMLPWYVDVLGYRDITAAADEPRAMLNERMRKVQGVTDYKLQLSFFNAEEDRWPLPDDSFDVVLCLEILEHLATDPMQMMAEINRVLRPGGLLVLTTPNSASWNALASACLGDQPYSYAPFFGIPGHVHRHNREYTLREVGLLVGEAGMDVVELISFGRPRQTWPRKVVSRLAGVFGIVTGRCPASHRGSKTLVAARKSGPIRRRWPKWLYIDPGQLADKLAEMGEAGRQRIEEWNRP